MTAMKRTAWKLAGYSLFAFYLVGDLYIWDGFLYQRFNEHSKPMDSIDGTPTDCIVYGEPITKNQLLTRCRQIALVKGKGAWDSLTALQQKTIRVQARLELIDEATLRLKTRANDLRLPNETKLAENQMKGLAARFETPETWQQLLASQKSSQKLLTDKLNARLKQKAMIEFGIQGSFLSSDKELQNYYDQIKHELTIPAHRELSHIFFATLDQDPAQVKSKAEKAYYQLEQGGDFAQLAATLSEDKNSAANAGKLKTIYQHGRPLLAQVDIFALPANKTTLIQSKLGWHIFLAGDIIPARTLSFDEAKESMRSALRSLQQSNASQLYIQSLRNEAHEKKRIIVPDPN